MRFSDSIPERILDNSNTQKFCNVLDGLQTFKMSKINEAMGFYNPLVSMRTDWVIRALEDYGFFGIPDNYPIEPLIHLYLNANNIVGLKGSKRGLKLWLNVMTLGDVTYDDTDVRTNPQFIIPDSDKQGYITAKSEDTFFYLVTDSDLTPRGNMPVEIRSVYFNLSFPGYSTDKANAIRSYVSTEIMNWVGFSDFLDVNFTYISNDHKVYDELLNDKFIEL